MRAIPESRLWHHCCHSDVDRQENPSSGWLGPELFWKCQLHKAGARGDPQPSSVAVSSCTGSPLFPWWSLFWSMVTCFHVPHEVLGQGSAEGALDVEDIQLHAFVNLVFEPNTSVCHCLLLTTAESEHARNRRHPCKGIICSPRGVSSV